MRTYTSIMLMAISFFAIANTDSHIGYWSVNCGGFGGNINISKDNIATVNVNDNNLLIEARLMKTNKNSTQLFFVDVLESRNSLINWDSISHQKPIAKLVMDKNIIDMTWLGFYDEKLGKHVWNMLAQFLFLKIKMGNIIMNKCRLHQAHKTKSENE